MSKWSSHTKTTGTTSGTNSSGAYNDLSKAEKTPSNKKFQIKCLDNEQNSVRKDPLPSKSSNSFQFLVKFMTSDIYLILCDF